MPNKVTIDDNSRSADFQLKDSSNTVINPATSDNQTSGSQKSQIVDGAGHVVGTDLSPDGDYHLNVSTIQEASIISSNSSTTNLNSGATFTGTSTSTLGVNAIQVSLKTDINCTVYVDQSPDGTNWDITDTFTYYYSLNNFSTTVQTVNSYFRVRVTNTSAVASTYFRLQSVLTPIVEALPRSLTQDGHLRTHIFGNTDAYGFIAENSPHGSARVITPTLIIGKTFEGTTIDPNFWTSTVANNGTNTQANDQIVLATGTTANGSAKITSVRRARYIPGNAMVERMVIQLGDTGTANNTKKWGMGWGATMPTITDGAYFQTSGTTFSIVTLKGNSATTVSSGSFNGTYGATYVLDTNAHSYEIYFTNKSIYFTIDGQILHTVTGATAAWANTVQNYVYLENTNSGGSTTNLSLTCRVAGILRLGPLLSQPSYKYQSGTTTGVVFKYGVGNLHGITISGVVNNSQITLYDNTAASGTVIWDSGAMTNQTIPFDIDFHGIPFFNGLTVVIATANCNVNIQYE